MQPMFVIAVAIILGAGMAGAFAVRRCSGNSGWVDVIWTLLAGATGVATAIWPDDAEPGGRNLAVALLVGLWSSRLGVHLARRSARQDDDPRYAALARRWGANAEWMMFLMLELQAGAALVLVFAVRLAAWNPLPFPRLVDGIALLLGLVAIAGEAIADAQLARFRRDPANLGLICDVGLWATSRHPNFFFEWLGWCATGLFAIAPTGGYTVGWLALSAPLLMYGLLVHVSGIPPLEAHMLATRGTEFRKLQRSVNAFFPGPRKSDAGIDS